RVVRVLEEVGARRPGEAVHVTNGTSGGPWVRTRLLPMEHLLRPSKPRTQERLRARAVQRAVERPARRSGPSRDRAAGDQLREVGPREPILAGDMEDARDVERRKLEQRVREIAHLRRAADLVLVEG